LENSELGEKMGLFHGINMDKPLNNGITIGKPLNSWKTIG
jgi:hypothetical protein